MVYNAYFQRAQPGGEPGGTDGAVLDKRPVVRWGEDGHPWVVDGRRRRLVRADSEPGFLGVWHEGEAPPQDGSPAAGKAAVQRAAPSRQAAGSRSPGWGGLRG
jgi:hypothetical protein